jgi:glutamine synthetase
LPGIGIAPATLSRHGGDYCYDMRLALRRQAQRLTDRGWTALLGVEPEFYVFGPERGSVRPLFGDSPEDTAEVTHDVGATLRASAFLRELADALDAFGLEVAMIDHEFGWGQYEVTFAHAEVLESADRMALFRFAATEIARRHGGRASFMAKPSATQAGSGLHLNFSLVDATSGENIVAQRDPTKGVWRATPTGRWFAGGILRRLHDFTAICCPTVNSYRRFVAPSFQREARDQTWAPIRVALGETTRTAALRYPPSRPCLELRHPDPNANVYLTAALTLAAGLEGIDDEREPSAELNVNTFDLSEHDLCEMGVGRIARSLGEALDCLAESAFARDAIGSPLIEEFVKVKRRELADFEAHVSDWERMADG